MYASHSESVWLWISRWVASFVALLASQVAASTKLALFVRRPGVFVKWRTGNIAHYQSHRDAECSSFSRKQEFQSNNSQYSLFTKRSHFYWPTVRFSLAGPWKGEAFQLLSRPWVCHCVVQNRCLHTWRSADAGLLFSILPCTELVPTHWKKNTPAEGCVGSAGLWNRCGMRRGEKKQNKTESRVAHWPPNSPCMFYINQLEFFFSLFVFHDEFQTQDEKNTSAGLFFGSRCVFSDIMKACVWVSPPISLGD